MFRFGPFFSLVLARHTELKKCLGWVKRKKEESDQISPPSPISRARLKKIKSSTCQGKNGALGESNQKKKKGRRKKKGWKLFVNTKCIPMDIVYILALEASEKKKKKAAGYHRIWGDERGTETSQPGNWNPYYIWTVSQGVGGNKKKRKNLSDFIRRPHTESTKNKMNNK